MLIYTPLENPNGNPSICVSFNVYRHFTVHWRRQPLWSTNPPSRSKSTNFFSFKERKGATFPVSPALSVILSTSHTDANLLTCFRKAVAAAAAAV